jgi:PrtD family type I secretion system ABC transporter
MPSACTKDPIGDALRACRSAWLGLGVFSCVVNLLQLTGPLYMLQVYDRVLTSGSVPTLAALSALVVGLFLAFGALEFARSVLLARVAARLHVRLGEPAFDSLVSQAVRQPGGANDQPLRDLASLRAFISSSAPLVIFDLPWTPVFIAVLFLVHAWLGVFGLASIGALAGIALCNEIATRRGLASAGTEQIASHQLVNGVLRNAEVVEALGMRGALRRRWQERDDRALRAQVAAAERAAAFSAGTKALRLVLQSAVLGVGAVLALRQEISAGTMVAASIIVGRALGPIEQAVGQWRSFTSTRTAYLRLRRHFEAWTPHVDRMPLPRAKGHLRLERVVAVAPGSGAPILSDVSFELAPGTALGVIGASAAGKSTLARIMVGVWPPASGVVRLDDVDIATLDRTTMGPQIGYLPQSIELFAGKVSENIARFDETATAARVIEAAELAGVHEMILKLPDGYDTEIGEGGGSLSAGQRQRLALARALYGGPSVVVLDEPNSNLDADGDEALTQAIRRLQARRCTIVVIAHRPSAISAVDSLLFLEGGRVRAFGPKEDVLRQVLKPQTAPPIAKLRTA